MIVLNAMLLLFIVETSALNLKIFEFRVATTLYDKVDRDPTARHIKTLTAFIIGTIFITQMCVFTVRDVRFCKKGLKSKLLQKFRTGRVSMSLEECDCLLSEVDLAEAIPCHQQLRQKASVGERSMGR